MRSLSAATLLGAFTVLALTGCAGVAAPDPSVSASTEVATGDRRTVTAPIAPTTVCTTVDSQLAMPDGRTSDADEASPPDTARIQAALDSCVPAPGTDPVAIRLEAAGPDAAFLSGPLVIRGGEVLLLDPAVTLFASINPADYQVAGAPACGSIGGAGNGCKPFLTLAGSHSGVESEPSPTGAQGRIDGRGGDPMLGTSTSWWQLASEAKSAGAQNVPRLIQARRVDDVTVAHVDLTDSPGFHISFQNGEGFTAWGVRIRTPATARNTDGIDPAGATDVTIADSWIMDGDDGVAIKAGSAHSAHISILDDHFFGTHGISIGSETTAGVSDVLVASDTVSGTDLLGNASVASAGVRIKSSAKAGGSVDDVTYRDVCIDAVKAPIDLDPDYGGATGSTVPSFTGVRIEGLRAIDSPENAMSILHGWDGAHPLQLTLADTVVDSPADLANAEITQAGTTFAGDPLTPKAGVTVTTMIQSPDPPSCTFPAYPAL